MYKALTIILLLTLSFPSKAQEKFVVRGFLESTSIQPSANFQRSMFCYFQGNYIVRAANHRAVFFTFRVDSVINGSFYNSMNELKKTPFNIAVALVNEAVLLDIHQYYTLQISRFPHTNYFYVDNMSRVYPNEQFLERLAEHNQRHQQNIDIFTTGTLYERRELLGRLQQRFAFPSKADFRYIPYILPYMTSKDSVAYYTVFHWHGFDGRGRMIGGEELWESKELYSDFLFNYLREMLPFVLPDRATTDSIGWHKWYESLFSRNECFAFVEYATTQSELIVNVMYRGINRISYFIPDMSNRMIHFATAWTAYTLNIDTDELADIPVPRMQFSSHNFVEYVNFSIQNNEVPMYDPFDRDIGLFKLDNDVFRRQADVIPLNLRYNESGGSSFTYPHIIVHSGNDFFVFTSQNPEGYNHLKAGKINRAGEWVIKPKSIYRQQERSWANNTNHIGNFAFHQSDKNETIFVFSDESYGGRAQRDVGAVIVYRLNSNLEVTDSVVLVKNFPRFDYRFSRTHLLKNDSTYLLLLRTNSNNNTQLFYKLLNNDLTPKTDFVNLSNSLDWNLFARPVVTSEGFLVSWNSNDLSENLTRAVLIDTSGRQSNIINISNQRIRDIFNIEFDENNVDIFIVDTDGNLIRKRINKNEFGL